MAAFRLICDVEMHGDWRFTDNMNLLFGDPDETGTGLILKFSDPDLLRDFARQLYTHLGLNNDAAAKAVMSFAPSHTRRRSFVCVFATCTRSTSRVER